jgi:hypothetical protein
LSFNVYARKVRDPIVPINHRLSALGSCAHLLSELLKKQKRSKFLDPLIEAFYLDQEGGPSVQQILSAMSVLKRIEMHF